MIPKYEADTPPRYQRSPGAPTLKIPTHTNNTQRSSSKKWTPPFHLLGVYIEFYVYIFIYLSVFLFAGLIDCLYLQTRQTHTVCLPAGRPGCLPDCLSAFPFLDLVIPLSDL